jgi:excisionase family DNA binding protein
MPSHPTSLNEDLISPASGDRARAHGRKTTAIPKFFTIGQVAELLEVSTRTVKRWLDAKLLVAHRFGGVVRIGEQDLRAFLSQHRVG